MAQVRDRGAFGAPGEVAQLQEYEHQHLRGRDGCDREVGAAQPEAEPADRQARERRDHAAGEHADPRRHVQVDLEQRRGVRAQAEEGCVPERELLGIAAEQIPRRADEGEEEDPDEHVERERALHDERERGRGDREGSADADPDRDRHQRWTPAPRPRGRRASVARRSRKTTMRPESAPMNWMPSDSASPIRRLATRAPTTLPSVPRTTATKAISTNTCPTIG